MDAEGLMRSAVVMPVLAIAEVEHAVPLARALARGGLTVLEVTLRTSCALAAIRAIRDAVPGVQVGAGSVLTPRQLQEAVAAGASFAVSPGFTTPLAKAVPGAGVPWLPGVATASDIMAALDAGHSRLKFFPAREAGGPPALRAFAGPFPNVLFCPTGGVAFENARDYLDLGNVACVGGSWVAPADLVAAGDWTRITALAAQAAGLGRGRPA
jgi:2-dehydro-3-deoxyphosphogluconate aldolase/(4S)-4-hydroxy-2-oxoglutarate aldolase